jgi:RNA polymerase sigma-70 factor (sigma-E family)
MRIGDRDKEFKAFYEAEAEPLHRLAVLLARDPELGADLAQEALLKTYRAWARIQGSPGAYARKVLINLFRNAYRRRGLERRHSTTGASRAAETGGGVDERLRVAEALKALSPVRRATVLLRFYEDLSNEDIARILDRPVGTVKSDIHRSLEKLRPLLADQEVKESS